MHSDVAPVNAFPRDSSVGATASSKWMYEVAAHDWEPWIGRAAARSVLRHSGCYSVVHPGTSLRVISINTNYWYKQNFWLYDSDEPVWDPNGILSWMKEELHEAERLGQRAWLSTSAGEVGAGGVAEGRSLMMLWCGSWTHAVRQGRRAEGPVQLCWADLQPLPQHDRRPLLRPQVRSVRPRSSPCLNGS